jgi:SOS-response transcriptional repressor LexA
LDNSLNWADIINQIINDLRLSTPDIEKLTGVSDAVLSQIRNGKTTRPYPTTIKKLEDGLKIRIDNSDPNNITYKRIDLPGFENVQVPQNKYPILSEIHAGIDDVLLRSHTGEFVFFVYKKIEGCFALRIVGDSMNGTFLEGDIILCDVNAELTNGCIVAIKLKDGRKMVKRYRDIERGYYMLYSDNQSYQPVTVHASEIEAVYRVVARQTILI